MNRLNQIVCVKEIDAKKEIYLQIQLLCNDFSQIIEKENLKFITDRLYEVIKERHRGLTFKYLEKAMIEMQTNCIYYRTVNVSTILTALNKVLQ